MSDQPPKEPAEGTRPTEGSGSYTARPSDEPPEEGTTRDHGEEEVERTGSGPEPGPERHDG